MAGKWTDLPEELIRWRQEMIDCVVGFETDAVVFCHFIAINVVVGAAMGAEELIVFQARQWVRDGYWEQRPSAPGDYSRHSGPNADKLKLSEPSN